MISDFDVPNGLRIRYRHLKTGGLYRIVCLATIEATNTPAVVYEAEKDGSVWVRPKDEFFDGRFIPVNWAGLPFPPAQEPQNG